jgi:hypothetical protein
VTYKVLKDVPLRPRKKTGKWPIAGLKVGGSFVIPKDERPASMNGLYALGRSHEMSLGYRTNEDGSVQVWRIK